jgi:hypothetical protein
MRGQEPDADIFPDFDHNLRVAMQRETEMLFESIVLEDRSALTLLDADYTFVNERLARHYGIPNIYGSQFRRVPVTEDARRGILGHGSILTLTSYANRTAPVIRGKYVLTNIPRHAAAGTAGERSAARRDARQADDDARADGGASTESGVCRVSSADGSHRPVARELRRHRPVAHARQRRGIDASAQLADGSSCGRPGDAAAGAAAAARDVRSERDRRC